MRREGSQGVSQNRKEGLKDQTSVHHPRKKNFKKWSGGNRGLKRNIWREGQIQKKTGFNLSDLGEV